MYVFSFEKLEVWKEAIPAMRAFVDGMNGRANYTLLPVCNLYRPKKITDPAEFARHLGFSEAEILQGFTNYSDGTHFTDGTGFALPVYTDAAVTIEAAAGASFISTAGYAGSAIVAGVYFSVDGRLYRVESNEGGVLRINPPLRATIAAGTTLEIEAPTVRVRFSDDTVGRFAARHDRFGEGVRISVVEAFL